MRWANGRTARSSERISTIEPPATDSAGVTTACLSYVYEGLPARLGLVRFAGPERVAEGFRRHAAGLKQRAERLAGSRG